MLNQRIIQIDGAGTANLSDGLIAQVAAAKRHNARHIDLAKLGEQVQQRLRITGRALEVAQLVQCVSHRDRLTNELLLQLVMRQTQQIVLANELLQALILIMASRLCPAQMVAPDAGYLADDHDHDQTAEKILLRELTEILPIKTSPSQQENACREKACNGAVAQSNHHGRKPGPWKIRINPQRIRTIHEIAQEQGECGNQDSFGNDDPGLLAGYRELAKWRAFEFIGGSVSLY